MATTSKPTFTWFPEYDAQLSEEPKINVTKFGDGYEQRVLSGINTNPQKWTLQFTMSRADTNDILTFLRARNGIQAFYWTSPLNETITVVCRSWKTGTKQGHIVMNVDFEQVFEQ